MTDFVSELPQAPSNPVSQTPVDTLNGDPILGPNAAGLSVAGMPQQPTTSFDPTLTGQGQTDPNAQIGSVAPPSATGDALGAASGLVITPAALAQRSSQLAKLYPGLKNQPQTIASLASLPIADEDLYGSVGQTMVASQAQVQAVVLSQLDAPDRWKRWQGLSKESQAAILQTGMPAPSQPNPARHKSFWDGLGDSIAGSAGEIVSGRGYGIGGVVGGALGLIGDSVSAGTHAVGVDALGPIANAAGAGSAWKVVERAPGNVMQFPSHVYRYLDVGATGGMGIPGADPSLANVTGTAKLDPSYISRAWEATSQGKPMYREQDYHKAQALVGNDPDKFSLAVATAQSGGDVTLGVQKMMGPAPAAGPTPQYSQRASTLLSQAQGDANFAKAVRTLQMGGTSWGRDGARDMGLKEGSQPYSLTSGSLDAVYDWYTNPLMAAGRVNSITKAARGVTSDNLATAIDAARLDEGTNAAITAGNTTDRTYMSRLATLRVGGAGLSPGRFVPGTDAQAVADTASRRRYLVALADHVNQNNAAGWLLNRPADAKAYQAFVDHVNTFVKPSEGPDVQITPNHVLDWLDQGAGRAALAKGQFASYLTPNDVQLPRLSKTGALAVQAKVAATPLGRIAPDLPLSASDVAPTQGALAKQGLLGTLASSPYKASELLRASIHTGPVVLAGPDALPSFGRYVRQYLLPSNQRDQLINAFSDAANTAARRDIVRQASEAGFRAYGLDATEAGQNWIDKTLSGMRENYSPAGRDVLPDGSHRDTLAPDLEEAQAVAAPTLRDLAQAGRETNTLGVIRGGLTNPALETMMHRYWSPFALLRLGFVPRIVSEEFMTALMRLSPSQVVSGYAGSWLPRIANRMDAYSQMDGSNPVSKLGAILASKAAGVADDLALRHLSPEAQQASQMMAEARGLHADTTAVYKQVAKLADRKAKLASSLSTNAPEVAEAGADLDAKVAEMREIMDRAGRNPIVRQAYGKLFATGGGYLHSIGTTGDLLSVDGQYQPLANLAMRGHFQTVTRGQGFAQPDPAYLSSAAEYLGKFGRSPLLRSGLDAISGYGGDARTLTHLRAAFHGSSLAGTSDTELLTNLRTAFHSAPPDVQDALRYYQRATSAGAVGAQVDAAGSLRDMHVASDPKWKDRPGPDLTPEVRDLIDRTIGAGNFRPRVKMMADEEAGRAPKPLATTLAAYRKTRSANVKDRIALGLKGTQPDRVYHTRPENGGPLDGEHIATMFSDPAREVIGSRQRAATVAEDALVRHMHSPAFAQYIPSSGHLQYDLAEPLPTGHTRLYYPAATPSWQPGQIALDSIDNPQLKADVAATVLNRRLLSSLIDANTENPTHQAIGLWAHPNPFRAERVAQHLAGEDAAVGYVDVPNAMRDAQRYENPTLSVDGHDPWHSEAAAAKDVTERTAARMGLGDRLQGFRISEEQQANGHVLREGHEVLPDGTWANGNSLEDNIRTLAAKNAQEITDAFLANGKFLHGPAHDLLSQEPSTLKFNSNHLKGVALNDLPETVSAPVDMMLSRPQGPGAAWDRITRSGFDKVISPALESMVRSEAFALNLAKGLRAAKIVEPHLVDQELRDFGRGVADKVGVHPSDLRYALDLAHDTGIRGGDMAEEHPDEHSLLSEAAAHDPEGKLADYAQMEGRVDDHLNQIATERAVTDTLPFVNNHHARSNLSEYMRNASPFLWAQESFLKRWARTLAYNPGTFEKLELGLHGLGTVGEVHKDANGQDAVTIPGSGALTHLLGSVGLPYTIAAAVPFTMEVKNLTPGFARPATPAAGPLLTVPLAMLMGSQPEAAGLAQAAGIPPSSHTAGANAFDQLVPAGWARNLFGALLSKPDSQQWASARLQAMQMLAASGHAPTPGADAATLQTWQNQVANWTRNVYILRGALGFFTPATPTFDPSTVKTLDGGVGQLHADLQADIALFGVTEGTTRFMTAHPDAGAYTVFATSSAGGENVPATAAAEQTMQQHPGFFADHPYAGAYFLPPAPGAFDRAAYAQQLSDGLRVRKGWDTLSREIVNAAASQTYYTMHDDYLQALAGTTGDSQSQTAIKKAWSAWSQQFQSANPLFADQLNSSTGQATRGNVLDDLRNALASGNTPSPQAAGQLSGLLQLYDYWVQAHQALAASSTAGATDTRRQLDAAFAQMSSQYVAQNPLAAQFYSRTIVPEIAQQDQTLGHALEAVNQ